MSAPIYDIPVRSISGKDESLGEYKGSVALIVNVASKCGLTPQYEGLEKLYRDYRDRGLVVLGFPANDFAGQEPGTNEEIQTFCRSTFGVEFPMFEKISVTGETTHPLYRALIQFQPKAASNADGSFREKLKGFGMTPNPEPGILWNFEKFLVSRAGDVVGRFSPEVTPDDPLVVNAIEAELARG
jgi:glutathione peroxidase